MVRMPPLHPVEINSRSGLEMFSNSSTGPYVRIYHLIINGSWQHVSLTVQLDGDMRHMEWIQVGRGRRGKITSHTDIVDTWRKERALGELPTGGRRPLLMMSPPTVIKMKP